MGRRTHLVGDFYEWPVHTHTHSRQLSNQQNLQQAGRRQAAPLGRGPNLNCGQQVLSLEGFHLRPDRLLAAGLLAAGRCLEQREMARVRLGFTYGMPATLSTHL